MHVKKIEIDHQKCTTPYACKLCLKGCTQSVFVVLPVKMEKFKETDPHEPGAWKLFAKYADHCVACNDCVELCPVKAINIII